MEQQKKHILYLPSSLELCEVEHLGELTNNYKKEAPAMITEVNKQSVQQHTEISVFVVTPNWTIKTQQGSTQATTPQNIPEFREPVLLTYNNNCCHLTYTPHVLEMCVNNMHYKLYCIAASQNV